MTTEFKIFENRENVYNWKQLNYKDVVYHERYGEGVVDCTLDTKFASVQFKTGLHVVKLNDLTIEKPDVIWWEDGKLKESKIFEDRKTIHKWKKLKVGDIVFHNVFGEGTVDAIRPDKNAARIRFKWKGVKDIRLDIGNISIEEEEPDEIMWWKDGKLEEAKKNPFIDLLPDDPGETVIDYLGNEIPINRAVWCEYDKAWCLKKDAIWIDYQGFYTVPDVSDGDWWKGVSRE